MSGRTHAGSDLDLGVLFERAPSSLDDVTTLGGELQALVPGREVDVVVVNHADPLLLKQITESCVLLYGSPARLARLKLYAFKRYTDHRRFLRMERDYVRRHAAPAGS